MTYPQCPKCKSYRYDEISNDEKVVWMKDAPPQYFKCKDCETIWCNPEFIEWLQNYAKTHMMEKINDTPCHDCHENRT